jgi:hypothetical protein
LRNRIVKLSRHTVTIFPTNLKVHAPLSPSTTAMNTFSAPVTSLDSHVDFLAISDSDMNSVGRDQTFYIGPIALNFSLISFGGDPGVGNLAVLGPYLWNLCVKAPRVVLRKGVM